MASLAACISSSSIRISSTNSCVAPVRVAITGFPMDIASISTTGIPSGTPDSSCLESKQKISHSLYKTFNTLWPTSPNITTLFSRPNFFAYPDTSTPLDPGLGLPTSHSSISYPSLTSCEIVSSKMSCPFFASNLPTHRMTIGSLLLSLIRPNSLMTCSFSSGIFHFCFNMFLLRSAIQIIWSHALSATGNIFQFGLAYISWAWIVTERGISPIRSLQKYPAYNFLSPRWQWILSTFCFFMCNAKKVAMPNSAIAKKRSASINAFKYGPGLLKNHRNCEMKRSKRFHLAKYHFFFGI